ncbi:hypothetical protein SUDANB6_05600 [Streptomyces sp. enrichment culture]
MGRAAVVGPAKSTGRPVVEGTSKAVRRTAIARAAGPQRAVRLP